MINFGEFPSHSLESPSVVASNQYVCYFLMRINQGQVWMNYDIEMLTKKNLSEDRLPPTLDGSVLHLRRALIFFLQCLFNTFSELFFFIYQIYKI